MASPSPSPSPSRSPNPNPSPSPTQVYTSWQWTGTHRGPYHYKTDQGEYRDLAPSGVRVHVQGIAVDVCRDGKIIDHAAYYDEANLR